MDNEFKLPFLNNLLLLILLFFSNFLFLLLKELLNSGQNLHQSKIHKLGKLKNYLMQSID